MTRPARLLLVLGGLTILAGLAAGVERFPPPQFESGYQLPQTTTPPPQADGLAWLDLAVLAACLLLSIRLILTKRSRRGVFWLMLIVLGYFGLWRKGCICPIGAIQNISLAIFEPAYAIPLTVIAFFALPILATLFYGRVFCGGVCPLGALQDVVVIKPIQLPRWLEHALRFLAYLFLGAAVLFAATGSAFIICQYDPFVSFFRLSGGIFILILGACLLLLGLFIGRPYCRFLCPLGIIFRHASRFSAKRVTITPADCIQCRLCEDACPFNAIDPPNTQMPVPGSRRKLALLILLLPVLVGVGGFLVSRLSQPFSRMHATVRLADRIWLEENGKVQGALDESDAFRTTGRAPAELYRDAQAIQGKFQAGTWIYGGFLGLVLAGSLIQLSVKRTRTGYEANRANCFACGRCYQACPVDRQWREENSNIKILNSKQSGQNHKQTAKISKKEEKISLS